MKLIHKKLLSFFDVVPFDIQSQDQLEDLFVELWNTIYEPIENLSDEIIDATMEVLKKDGYIL